MVTAWGSSSLTRDEPRPSALRMQRLSHWTTREVPLLIFKIRLQGAVPSMVAPFPPLCGRPEKKNQRGLKPEVFRKPSVLKPNNGCVRPHLDSASKWATLSNSSAGACVLKSDEVPISILPFADSVTKGKLLNLSEPPFPDLYDESNNMQNIGIVVHIKRLGLSLSSQPHFLHLQACV